MSSLPPRDLTSRQQDLRASTAQRLHEIVEAAERAAEGVIDDAETQARRYLEDARARADREAKQRFGALSELTDSLLREAAALRRQAERLEATLEEAKETLGGGGGQADEDPGGEGGGLGNVAHLTSVVSFDAAEPDRDEEKPREDRGWPRGQQEPRQLSAAGARLLATQMAVSGSSREEIELRLRNGFGIEDTGAILDAILGPER